MSAFGTKRTSGGGRFSFICAPSASRGHAHERAAHLIRNTLHGAIAYANLACDRFRILPGRIFGKFFSTAAKLVKFLGDASDAAHQIGSAVGIAGVFIEELVRVIEVAHQV